MPGQESLLQRAYAPFVIGAVTLVTLGALADRATSTVLPNAARQLDGVAWFGLALAAPGVSFLLGAALAGVWADRSGARQPLITGVVCFILGNVIVATSPSMITVVLGRIFAGFAEAMFDIALTVMVVAALPEALRPKIYALYSTAWLLPSILGPQLAGWTAELVGWRPVFFGCALLALPVGVLLIRLSRSGNTGAAGEAQGTPLRYAVLGTGLMAAMSVLTPFGKGREPWSTITMIIALLLAVATVGLMSRLGPPGLLRFRPGLPAVFALLAVLNLSFGTVGSFLPFYVQQTRGVSPAIAGLVLTITGVCWAIGSWLQSSNQVQSRTSVRRRLRLGFSLIMIGSLLLGTLPMVDLVPLAVPYGGWALAGVGIGIVSPTLNVTRLALTPESEQGRGAAAASLLTATSGSSAVIIVGMLLGRIAIERVGSGGQLILVVVAALCAVAVIMSRRVGAPQASEQVSVRA
ncbi:MFS transporter [Microlunatus soli]|uniref:Major Facilitator Superfamily protein n=1 Tax=Microlunatus soli TaxID=630515 RepID=A0A1H2ADR2_9ACTN|nr:MFS transporter [Microlunatus soli]SDT44007.1 Major Facilitator Superfamily protein [Microlunatus soli]